MQQCRPGKEVLSTEMEGSTKLVQRGKNGKVSTKYLSHLTLFRPSFSGSFQTGEGDSATPP